MGLVTSSQAGSTSVFAQLYIRSIPSEITPSVPQQPLAETTTSISKNPPILQTPVHVHPESLAVNISVPTKLKERKAWYNHLKGKRTVSKKSAKKSALIVRSLIVGPPNAASPVVTKAAARPQLTKIKSRLIEPKSAKRIIAELRALPALETEIVTNNAIGASDLKYREVSGDVAPIHAVCLANTDAEEDRLHFSKLKEVIDNDMSANLASVTALGSASLESFMGLINDIHIIDLINTPDFGLGQPGNGSGMLAGAVPTPETVIEGVEQITPQLMALGFAVGKAILPDHKGIYPPTDRMSVITYWWGFELVLPPPSLDYLSRAHSVSGAVMNFLTALSLVNNGVREILPLIRYISQFVDFEFNQIKGQDQGKGVVCAATWIMPAALVPRSWDFLDPPVPSIIPPKSKDERSPPSDINPTGPKQDPAPVPTPSPDNGLPLLTPAPINSALNTVVAIESPSNTMPPI